MKKLLSFSNESDLEAVLQIASEILEWSEIQILGQTATPPGGW